MHTSMAGVEHGYRRIPGLMDELRARTISGTVIATTVVGALLLCPAVVRAENIVIPFLGRSFGESDLVKVTTLGASLASQVPTDGTQSPPTHARTTTPRAGNP